MIGVLSDELNDLKSSIEDLRDILSSPKETQRECSLTVFKHITQNISKIEAEAQNLRLALEVRDENILALGEKLSNLRAERSEPFYVSCEKKRSPRASRRKSLYRDADHKEWTKQAADSHMKELSDQIARLSLLPMGLAPEDLEEQIADISATRLFEAKALNLITVGRKRGLSDDKIKNFLKKKGLPDVTIQRCFEQNDGKADVCVSSRGSSNSVESDSEEDSSEFVF